MDFITGGILCVVLLLVLMGTGLQIGLSFVLSGLIVATLLVGLKSALALLGQVWYFSVATPTWACIPLFILMGDFGAIGGFAERAYRGVNAFCHRLPGSLGVATCFSCAAFGAISGSSIAATVVFGKLAIPEMNRYHYDKSFSTACIASAGTFASMIPPSLLFVVYALFTQQSIGKLFAAGFVPGLITATVYSISIVYRVRKNPSLAPRQLSKEETFTPRAKREAVFGMWPIFVIATIVLGGIYSGLFTPTEAAAAGALVTLFFGWQQGDIRRLGLVTGAMKDSANTTAMLFLLNIGALFYSRVLAMTRLPAEISVFVQTLEVPRIVTLLIILLILFFLGMLMVPIGIYAMTLPIFFPLIVSLKYDPIWFGVVCLKMMEIGAVTPPVGLNVYAMKGVVGKDISLEDIFRGIWPFVLCDLTILGFLILFPEIATWLPNLLFR